MIRILQVYPQLNNAGTEMVIRNVFDNINKENVMFDFLVQKKGELDDYFVSKGSRIYYISTDNYENKLIKFFENNNYQVVHTHTHQEMGIVLKIASQSNVPCRIAHSHNYRGDLPKIFSLIKMFKSWNIEKYATHFLGCSNEALKWLFPRNYKKGIVWNNGIDICEFLYDENIRLKYRKEFNIPLDAKVICHVGRFSEQKNHKKIVQLLNKMQRDDDSIFAVLVGVGPLLDEIKAGVEYNNRVRFLGNRKDVSSILSMSDLFLFPSLYEGLGIVAIEAQVSGLCCIASNNVPRYANLNINKFVQISLNDADDVWIQNIYNNINHNLNDERKRLKDVLIGSDYDITKIANVAETFYLSFDK